MRQCQRNVWFVAHTHTPCVLFLLFQCLALLNKLKELCEQKTRIFHDRLSKCREILTPEQVLKLLVWIHEHNETVAQACPGWGSEHLPVVSKQQQTAAAAATTKS